MTNNRNSQFQYKKTSRIIKLVEKKGNMNN